MLEHATETVDEVQTPSLFCAYNLALAPPPSGAVNTCAVASLSPHPLQGSGCGERLARETTCAVAGAISDEKVALKVWQICLGALRPSTRDPSKLQCRNSLSFTAVGVCTLTFRFAMFLTHY